MWNAVINLLFIGIGLIIGFANTLGDNLGITLAMASILAIGTLHSCCVFQEVATKSTAHNVIELLCNELVSLFFVNFFLLLSDSTLTIQTNIEWSPVL